MTKDQIPGTGPDEVERRDYDAFVDSLAGALDLRGGLGEALDVAGYTAMSSHIANLLNLEAGLQSALAEHVAETNPDQANAGQEELDGVLGEFPRNAASRSLKTRLAIRIHSILRPWRSLSACVVAAVFTGVVVGIGMMVTSTAVTLLLPFVAGGFSVVGLAVTRPWIKRLDQRFTPAPTTALTAALAQDTAAVQEGSLEQALTGLAQILAESTRAQRAVVWLAVEEKLVSAASYPPGDDLPPRTIASLAALLALPDVDHVVPVLDGSMLRTALTISKPGRPVTPADQRLMQDIANGAELLLRGAQLTAELEDRVRRADELATDLQASRQRLTRAWEVERHRMVSELTQVTTTQLATLGDDVHEIRKLLSSDQAGSERTRQALAHARTGLDELIDRFRVITRGVYPAVLHGEGPAGALKELATDLPRQVRVSGRPSQRLSWEIESVIYWLAASAMQQLAGQPAEQPLHVHLEHTTGQLAVRIADPAPATATDDVLAALTVDMDRLAALGGDVEITEDGAGGIALRAWLPDQLEPSVDDLTQRRPSLVRSHQVAP